MRTRQASYKNGGFGRNPIERVACPLCGWIRTVKASRPYQRTTQYHQAGEAKQIRFDKVDLDNAPIWRLERLSGKGRGSKEASIELIDNKTLAELPEDLKHQIKNQCQKILEILK